MEVEDNEEARVNYVTARTGHIARLQLKKEAARNCIPSEIFCLFSVQSATRTVILVII